MLLRTLLLLLLVFLLLRFVMRLVRGVAEGMGGSGSRQAHQTNRQSPVKMVADPVCGTYVVPGKALQASRGRETHYFCSSTCRDKWEAAQ